MVTRWRAWCKTPYTSGHHSLTFDTEAEALAYASGPMSAGLIRMEPVTVEAEESRLAREREWRRIRHTTCLLPPARDMLLIAAAKRTPSCDYRTIDPCAGSWKSTRERLEDIRNDKMNELLRSCWAGRLKETP